MSLPFDLLAKIGKPYDHHKYILYEVRDIKGMLESIRRGIHDHTRLFPEDVVNRRYLDGFARHIEYLEEEIDSWRMWAFSMPPELARREVSILRYEVLLLASKMGPAVEAQHFALFPVWSPPKTTTPWRQISLTKVRKFKKASQRARKQAREANAGLSAAKKELETMDLCLQFQKLKL